MPLTEETVSAGVDPLAMDDAQDDNNNIERIEHAPKENKKDDAAIDDEGRLYLWLSLLVACVGALVIIVVVLVAGGGDSDDDNKDIGGSSTYTANMETFPPVAMVNDMQAQLDMIREALQADEVTKPLLEIVPPTVQELEVKVVDQDAHAAVQAAGWVVLQDEYNAENQIVERFALATMYFETDGPNWIMKEEWLSSRSLCDNWYGIKCCGHFTPGTNTLCNGMHPEHLSFLDLSQNNLSGPFSTAFALLKDLHVLMLEWNNLRGPLRGEIVAAMPNLQTLFVQHNRLTGPFDPALVSNGALSTFYAQGNYFTGVWPAEYCVLFAYNFDCLRNRCMGDCCTTTDILDECTKLDHWYEEEPTADEDPFA